MEKFLAGNPKKKCSKLKLEELGYSCTELENQKINIDRYNWFLEKDHLIGLQICPHSDHTYCGKNSFCINYFDKKVSEVVPPHGFEPRTYWLQIESLNSKR